MKQFYFKSFFLSLLMMVIGNVGVLAQTPELTLDFTSAWTADGTNAFKTTIGGTEYRFSGQGGANFKFNSGYFMFGKSGAYIDLPTVDFEVEKIEVVGRSGASASTKMNLYVGDDAVSTETEGCTGTNTYEIDEEYQDANTQYRLKVTSSHNAQITYVKYYKKQAASNKTLTGITLSGTYPQTFKVGDAFSHEGMTVTATFDDNSTSDVTSSATFTGYDMSTAGEQTVTVSYTSGDVTKTAEYGITVNNVQLENITLSGEYPTTFNVGDEFSHEGMTVTAIYDDNSTEDVTSDATFSGYDMSTAGEQTVTVSYTKGEVTKTTTYDITVNTVAVTGVTLDKTEAELKVGNTLTLTPTVAPENASNKNCTWSSDHPEYASVEDGVVTAVALGTATITVTTDDGNKTATCTVNVVESLSEVTVTGNLNNSDTGVFANIELSSGNKTAEGNIVTEEGNINVKYEAKTNYYLNSSQIRTYAEGTQLTFTAPDGYELTKIALTKTSGDFTYLETDENSYNTSDGTWEGGAKSVTFTGKEGTLRLTTAEVTIKKEVAKYELTLTAPENGTVTMKSATGADIVSGAKLPENTEVTIEATPTTGYLFEGWTTDPEGTIDDETSATATLTMPAADVTLTATFTKDPTVTFHTITWSVNGTTTTTEVAENDDIDFAAPESIPTGYSFAGWVEEKIDDVVKDAPTYVTAATATEAKTYYAVLTNNDVLAQTLKYDTWTYSGPTTNKNSYRLFGDGAYVESEEFDLSKLSKVIVYGGRFGSFGSSEDATGTIGDGTNKWKDFVLTGTNNAGKHEITGGAGLSGTGKLRIASTCGDGSNKGLRISKIEIFTNELPEKYYFTTIPETTQLTITSAEWATYVTPVPVKFTSDVNAWIITEVQDGVAQGERVTEVPEGTAVIVNGTEGTHKAVVIEESVLTAENMLQASDGTVTGDGTIWVLAVQNGDPGFARLSNGKTLSAGKAYLQVAAAGAKLQLVLDGEESGETNAIEGIETVEESNNGNDAWYNLQGVEVLNPQKGIYIHNGKKVVIK